MDDPITIKKLQQTLAGELRETFSDLDAALPLIYDELRQIAVAQMKRERANHTLQPTALANEAFMKLSDQLRGNWQSRAHFLAVAATIMRRILVDHARAHRAAKRGGGAKVTLHPDADAAFETDMDVAELDRLLQELHASNERQARVVEMRFFAGMTVEQVAAALNVSEKTVKNDWRFARAWLASRLGE